MLRVRGLIAALAGPMLLGASGTIAQDNIELEFFCTSDSTGCEAWEEVLKPFEEQNPGVTVLVNHAPYTAELESLPVQLAAGEGPDLGVVTNIAGLMDYYLDLRPYIDADYIKENYGPTQIWLLGNDASREEVFGFQQSLTVNGPFVNSTLFEQAGVALPAEGATWEDWAAATKQVAEATGTPYGMVMDRSGHRFASLAISYGAELMDADNRPIIDDGFRKAAELMVQWHADGLMPFSLWGAIGGATYADDFEDFRNAQVVLNYAGSWAISRTSSEVGDLFEWKAVPALCGAVSCTSMPGGSAIAAFKNTEHPEQVAKLIDFMSKAENVGKVLAQTRELPANAELVASGIEYEGVTPAEAEAIATFTASIPKITAPAYRFQGYPFQFPYMNAIAGRISQVINKELTLDEALTRIQEDVNLAIDSAGK